MNSLIVKEDDVCTLLYFQSALNTELRVSFCCPEMCLFFSLPLVWHGWMRGSLSVVNKYLSSYNAP